MLGVDSFMKVKRICSVIIDYSIACYIGFFLFTPCIDFIFNILSLDLSHFIIPQFIYSLPVGMIFSCKDFVYRNASIGKHSLGVEIVFKKFYFYVYMAG